MISDRDMFSIQLDGATNAAIRTSAVMCPVAAAGTPAPPPGVPLSPSLADEIAAFIESAGHQGKAGEIATLPRPLREPSLVYLAGVGDGDPAGWRTAGAAVARAATRHSELTVLAPADLAPATLRAVSEGLWLGAYQFRLRQSGPGEDCRLQSVSVTARQTAEREQALTAARIAAKWACFARDLTNTPSITKTPHWFVDQVQGRGLAIPGVTCKVWEQAELAADGFGGILAVGGGSARAPRLLQLTWEPARAAERPHVVLVGKGITYDTGGVDIKPHEGLLLMRKDMGGAATTAAATLAAAELELPVRITTLLPLAENMISGSAWRPGDVVTHYGGLTSEVHSTDAEGRVVVADALAYAAAQFEPDYLIDLATLTGASRIALGWRIAALFSENEDLVAGIAAAAQEAGERLWRLPLPDEYAKDIVADIADFYNENGNPGTILAALYLREFTGRLRDRWAHIDMSAPAWSAAADGELARGATGWGVRTLVCWLSALARRGE